VVFYKTNDEASGDDEEDMRPLAIQNLSAWDYSSFPLSPDLSPPPSPDGGQIVVVYNGPPRILEIACGNGSWCFTTKEYHEDWIIEGIDDADHWTEKHPELIFR
jgi:hypothetical protein